MCKKEKIEKSMELESRNSGDNRGRKNRVKEKEHGNKRWRVYGK